MIMSKQELEDLLEKLGDYKGRQTELITVYIPAGYDVNASWRRRKAQQRT